MNERAQPRTLAELARMVSASAVGGGVLAIEGGRTKLGWLRPGPGPDATLDTSALGGVIDHAHGDLTVTVRAGMRLADLQQTLAERGQRLAVDPPLGPGARATVGGVFATDDAGPARVAFGTLRELCIGAIVVLPDGTTARSGGRVIKNVAGFDLCKLYCGSRGTLGVVAELTLRLHPVPVMQASLRAPLSIELGSKLALDLFSGQITPTGITHQSGALWVRFEGSEAFVESQIGLAQERLVSYAEEIERLDAEASERAWRDAGEARRAQRRETTLACSTLPSGVSSLSVRVDQILGREDHSARVIADPVLGSTLIHLAPGPLERLAVIVDAVREHVQEIGGHVRLRDRPPELDAHVDPYGPLPSGLELMRAIKQRIDPVGRCMTGRYLPRL